MNKFKRFFAVADYCRQMEPGFFFFGIFARVADALRPFILFVISKVLLEGILAQKEYENIFGNIIFLLLLYFLFSVFVGYGSHRWEYHLKNFMRKHQMQKAVHLLEMDYEWTEDDEVQKQLTSLYNMETKNVFGFRPFSNYVNNTVGYGIGVLTAMYFLRGIFFTGIPAEGISEWILDISFMIIFAGIFSLTLGIVSYINKNFARAIGGKAVTVLRYLRSYNLLIYRYKSGKDIRLYNRLMMKAYSGKYRDYMEEIHTILSNVLTKSSALETAVSYLSMSAVFLFVGMKTMQGRISVSEVLLYIGMFFQLTQYAMQFVDSLSCLNASDVYRKELLDYLDRGEKIDSDEEKSSDIISSPSFDFKNISFSYPGSERKILKDLSLRISSGEKLAIVGVNGSGKTTLVKLLTGLYQNYSGELLVNGKNIRQFNTVFYQQLFAPLFQDFKLLALTLRENVSCFKEVSEKEIRQALEKIGMSEFVEKHGLDVYLTREFEESGVEISGGEAQKIAMARAIVKNAEVFILDEPTAALDPIAEYEIYSGLERLIRGKTTIFISHRLSSCKFCHRILVMDGGKIVQSGTHDSLLEDKNGKYYELWQAQAQYYEV